MGSEEKLPADCFEALEIEGLPDGVYRSQMPNSLYGGDEGDLLIPHWKEEGISHVVCLQQRDEMEYFTAMILPEECYPDEGLSCTWHPIPDHHGSDHSEKLLEDAKSVNEILDAGAKVVIHCHAGIGRTGTFIAAMLMARGASAEVAGRGFVTRPRDCDGRSTKISKPVLRNSIPVDEEMIPENQRGDTWVELPIDWTSNDGWLAR